jgi:PIN domain nuclease of toxin-antitoxin system
MQALLDTHALLWWLSGDPALTKAAHKIVAEPRNAVFVSAASAWEIATKVRLGKLPTAADLAADFTGHIESREISNIANFGGTCSSRRFASGYS